MSHKLLRSLIAKETEYHRVDLEIIALRDRAIACHNDARKKAKRKAEINTEIWALRTELSHKSA